MTEASHKKRGRALLDTIHPVVVGYDYVVRVRTDPFNPHTNAARPAALQTWPRGTTAIDDPMNFSQFGHKSFLKFFYGATED